MLCLGGLSKDTRIYSRCEAETADFATGWVPFLHLIFYHNNVKDEKLINILQNINIDYHDKMQKLNMITTQQITSAFRKESGRVVFCLQCYSTSMRSTYFVKR